MRNRDVVGAIVHGRPGVEFAFATDEPDEEATDLAGLEWPDDADAPKPQLATVQGWHDELEAARTSTEGNEAALRDLLAQRVATLEQAAKGWASLTPAQKDAATRGAVRGVAALIRLQLRELDATGD